MAEILFRAGQRLERHFRGIDSRSMQACLGSLPYATQAQDRCASAGLRLPDFRTAGFSDDGAISPKSAAMNNGRPAQSQGLDL
ncbi:hypothetical protein ACVINW_003696 [Bradyrhizobium sp. USDA 4461]